MESSPVRYLSFSNKENTYYSEEFNKLTAEQKKPLDDRELMGGAAAGFFRLLRIQDSELSKIWDLVSDGKPYLKLHNFMAAMRICSAKKQGKEIAREHMLVEENVLARRRHASGTEGKSGKKPAEKPREEVQKEVLTPSLSERTGEVDNEERTSDEKIQLEEEKFVERNQELLSEEKQVHQDKIEKKIISEENLEIKTEENSGFQSFESEKKLEEEKNHENTEKPLEIKKEAEVKIQSENSLSLQKPEQTKIQETYVDISLEDSYANHGKILLPSFKPQELKPETKTLVESEKPSNQAKIHEPPESDTQNSESTPKKHQTPSLSHFTQPPISSLIPLTPLITPIETPPIIETKPIKKPIKSNLMNSNIIQKLKDETNLIKEDFQNFEGAIALDASQTPNQLLPKAPLQPPPIPSLWPSESIKTDLSILVHKPILISSGWFGTSSYYIYEIITQEGSTEHSVKRRFSDLEWLHNQLTKNYKGLMIPPLPSKSIITNLSEQFIEERRAEMEAYLNILSKHPRLKSSKPFTIFTEMENSKFARAKQDAELDEEEIEFISLEDTVDRLYAHMKSKLQVMLNNEGSQNTVLASADEIVNLLQIPTEEQLNEYQKYSLNEQATNENVLFVLEKVCSEFSDIPELLNGLICQETSKRLHFNTEMSEELLRVQALKSAVETYNESSNEYFQEQNLISRKLDKEKITTDGSSSAAYLAEIQHAQDRLDELSMRLKEIEDNIENEVEIFREAREESLQVKLREIVRFELNNSKQEQDIWTKALDDCSN